MAPTMTPELIQWLKRKNVHPSVDKELYLSILITLITERNLLVSSTSVDRSISQLQFILVKLLGFKVQQIDALDITNKDTVDSDTDFVILTRLDETSVEYQNNLSGFFSLRPTLRILVVISNDDGVETALVNDINSKLLFRYPHLPTGYSHYDDFDVVVDHERDHRSINLLRDLLPSVTMIQEVTRYVNDILIHLRNHRMVRGGVPIYYKYEFELMVKAVALLNGVVYVTPTVVKLALRKFFPLHLNLVEKLVDEPTLNWGSDLKLVSAVLERWDQDLVVADVLRTVQPPL